MKRVRIVVLVIGLLPLVLGCGRLRAIEAGGVDIRGDVTNIYWADVQRRERGILGSILVEGILEKDTKFDKASISITDKTRIFEQRGPNRRPVTFEALDIGEKVEARFMGPVLKSHPVRAKALEIVILK